MQRSASLLDTPLVNTTYSSLLAEDSPQFTRYLYSEGNFYYELLQVDVTSPGAYTFGSSSSIDTFGLFYNNTFDPSHPETNLAAFDDDSDGSLQFEFTVDLDAGSTYYLVPTTYAPDTLAPFNLFVTGVAEVTLIPLNREFEAL